MSNLEIWDALSKTDPAHTKPFSRAGGFKGTAMKPIWIIRRLTEQFGPVGKGWGMKKPEFQVVSAPEAKAVLVYCWVECWHTDPTNTFWGVGGDTAVITFNNGKTVADDEAFKKAFTDAVNNAFKFLGVGADIRMGQFDDNKYVAQMEREFAGQPANDRAARGRDNGPTKNALDTAEKRIVRELLSCGDRAQLVGYLGTDEYKADKALLEEYRPSALYGPAPADAGDGFIPIKVRVKQLTDEFDQRDNAEPSILQAG